MSRRMRAGWKFRKLDDAIGNYIQVLWLPKIFGEWFLDVWKLYLCPLHAAPKAHPFASVV
ncbi:hypothetical protein [Chitinivorax sp. B]|uniref:hypothetical protein n=1 Tax=Chitinivorax sp. B TaxID=2502235 RepID=UPI0010FA3D35|nr:hypothetical protein [Chitinivorax sp. B]